MRKIIAALLVVGIAGAEVLYTDGSHDMRTCIPVGRTASIDFPCQITDLVYPDGVEATASQTSPKSVAVMLTDKTGSLTVFCKDRSYTIQLSEGKKCDLHKRVVDTRIRDRGIGDREASFDKEELLNEARTLMKGMVKGVAVRGYEIRPLHVKQVINNDDYLKAEFKEVYIGSSLVGFKGKIRNYSKYIDKKVSVDELMRRGYVLLYIQGMEGKTVVLQPEEEREIFIVAERGRTKLPYMER